MTHINTIFEDNFDTNITTKPSFYKKQKRHPASVKRGVVTLHINILDDTMGIRERVHFDPKSHDAYFCWVVSETNKADLENIIKALKKVIVTYTPTDTENIIRWEEGKLNPRPNGRWEFTFVVLVRKAGIKLYT